MILNSYYIVDTVSDKVVVELNACHSLDIQVCE
jgi:hypothetical protein